MYGADKILLEIVTGLDLKRFKPIVVLPTSGKLSQKLLENNIEVYVVNYPILRRKYFNVKGILKYFSTYRRSIRQILKIIGEQQIDIIHVNTIAVLEGISLKKKLKAPLVWHIHEILQHPKLVVTVTNALVGIFSDKIVAVSNAVSRNLIRSFFISKDKVKVIYNGIDDGVYNSKNNVTYLYKELGVPTEAIIVGMIGRVNSWKGQDDFLDAVIPIIKENKKVYAVLVGGVFEGQEWRLKELEKRVLESGWSENIKVLNFRNDTPNIHNFFDIFVLPSTNPDPLPTVVLEAMASGKPIVAYSHGGVTEMVENNKNGFLSTPRDTGKLKTSLNTLISDETLRNEFGENSLAREHAKFSISSFINNFSNLYVSVVKGSNKNE